MKRIIALLLTACMLFGSAAFAEEVPEGPGLVCNLAHGDGKTGTSGRNRTCNNRFWRPVLCQLSYRRVGKGVT